MGLGGLSVTGEAENTTDAGKRGVAQYSFEIAVLIVILRVTLPAAPQEAWTESCCLAGFTHLHWSVAVRHSVPATLLPFKKCGNGHSRGLQTGKKI